MIAISVTSPDLEDADDILLGVFQAVSSKGSDQADVILNLLEQYDIVDQTFAVCCDTTSSNTIVFSGAIVLLCTILNTLLLRFPCRRHMLAVNISHFIGSFTGEKTKAPCVSNFRRSDQQSRMRLKTLKVGSSLYEVASEALQFGKRARTLEYKKLCELFVGLDAPVFHYRQPGPCH
jgi:hypothetical protein